jgi:DNA-3-methyladenine glycosylase
MNVNLHEKLPRSFYARETVDVAYELIGKRIVRHLKDNVLIGRIIETEAYRGMDDAASHAYRGRTARNAPMFGPPGFTYIYFIYGMHWLFNISAHIEDTPGAILIRALEPEQGLTAMHALRGLETCHRLTNGPARLSQAMMLDNSLNNIDLVTNEDLYLIDGNINPGETISIGPRLRVPGDQQAKERPWRFWILDHPLVSL